MLHVSCCMFVLLLFSKDKERKDRVVPCEDLLVFSVRFSFLFQGVQGCGSDEKSLLFWRPPLP